jgi:twinkle protein
MLSQVTLDLLYQKRKVLVISLEMTPAAQMLRMSRQAHGNDPTIESIKLLHESVTKNLWIYNQVGSLGWKRIMAVCRYAQEKFGIDHFIIDSMMKAVRGEDDLNGQKEFIDDICGFAMSRKVHVHIVHHVRKGESEDKMPDKFDVRGSSSIIDQVDNIHIVFRNKKNEGLPNPDKMKPTAALKVAKCRHGDYEGILGFWFDPKSMQYLENIDSTPTRYEFKKSQYR